MQADRDWYNQEEGGIVDETHNPFVGDESKFEQREVELQKKLVLLLSPNNQKFQNSALCSGV